MFYYTQGNLVDLWTNNQFSISILAIALFGGIIIGLFIYSNLLGLAIGLKAGLAHGLVAGLIWILIYTSYEIDSSTSI